MKPLWLALAVSLFITPISAAQDSPAAQPRVGNYHDFYLTAVAPETPALKYRLLPDPTDEQPGDAADTYRQACLLIGSDDEKLIDDAPYDINSPEFADQSAVLCKKYEAVFPLLQAASLQDHGDWSPELRKLGLQDTQYTSDARNLRPMEKLVQMRALQQIRADQIDDAVATLRWGYALADSYGQSHGPFNYLFGPTFIATLNKAVAELMNRADAPNLYWALANIPRPMFKFRHMLESERIVLLAAFPILAKARSTSFTKQDWQEYLDESTAFLKDNRSMLAQSNPATLPTAQAYYAATRHISLQETTNLDNDVVLATYTLESYQAIFDDQAKVAELPYPEMLSAFDKPGKDIQSISAMSFPVMAVSYGIPTMGSQASVNMRVDQEIAALTIVEAIRSYAAANNGALPAHLENVTETPVPLNPRTDKPFDYQV